jgi:hypothetical protein
MEKQISFSGVDLTPYSDISPDGQCSALHNVELHNGALRPSLLAGEEFSISGSYSDSRLVHVHATSAFRHLIFLSSNNVIYWADEDSPTTFTRLTTILGTSVIKSVGNTLIALSDSGVQYYIWRDGSYRYIGSKPPEIGIKFGLECGNYDTRTDNYNYKYQSGVDIDPIKVTIVSSTDGFSVKIGSDTDRNDWTNVTTFSDFIWANVNMTLRKFEEHNIFYAPFFVRYAYTLYDGTVTMASCPALMIPCTSNPAFRLSIASKTDTEATINEAYNYLQFKLCLKVDHDYQLDNWRDIISSVSIFVTPQTTPWENDTLLYRCKLNQVEGYGLYASNYESSFSKGDIPSTYFLKRQLSDTAAASSRGSQYYVVFDTKSDEDFKNDLISNMQFYKVTEYNLDEVITLSGNDDYSHVDFKGAKLTNLVQKELLKEEYDYHSHDTLIPTNAYVYNSRLHLFDIQRKLFSGFSYEYTNPLAWASSWVQVEMYIHIKADDGTERVVKTSSNVHSSFKGLFYYYPDSRAYLLTMVWDGQYFELPLAKHPFMNGSYYLDWSEFSANYSSDTSVSASNSPIPEFNKLYVSDADNPFVFPTSGAYTIGTGQILGVATIATPLSTGQAGQFQMMFFCSDGNFAYRVEDDGTYSTPTPMQRDVCTLPSSITILDSEVLFLTEKGAMITNGMSMNCINRQLDGVPDTLPSSLSSSWSIPDTNIAALLQTATVAYDYANSRILFFTGDGSGNALVYSLTDQSWSSATFPAVRTVLNIYPYSYVQMASDGHIVRLADSYTYADSSTVSGLIFTRPLKLDSYALKRIHQFALQGTGAAATVWIYASQDAVTWTLLGKTSSLTRRHIVGRSFKYFRFAVETRLSPSDNISGLRLEYEVSRSMRYR